MFVTEGEESVAMDAFTGKDEPWFMSNFLCDDI